MSESRSRLVDLSVLVAGLEQASKVAVLCPV